MAAIANPVSGTNQVQLITPQDQLRQLNAPVIAEISPLLLPPLANLVSQYSEETSHWYTALSLMQKAFPERRILPERISPLPDQMVHILHSKSAVNEDQQVKDDQMLPLIPEELGNIRQMLRLFEEYGDKTYGRGEHPLKMRYFWPQALVEHGDTAPPPTHFALITKDVMPGTRNKTFNDQVDKVAALSKKAFAQYEVPTLRDMIAAIFLHYIATGEMLFPSGNEQNNHVYICTRVLERTAGYHLMAGGFAPSGLSVDFSYFDDVNMGVAALRKF